MSTLSRDFVADIEIRADGTGRTVHGIVVPYGQEARVSDGGPAYREMFAPGAFARDLTARAGNYRGVKLLFQHDSNTPIGRAVDLREETSGLYGAFQITPEASRGDEALALLRDGVLDSFSVGFRPIEKENRDGVVVRTRAALREASLVTFPAYAGALIGGVRALTDGDAALAQQLLITLAAADTQLDPICDALCAADGALDQAQAVIAQILGVPDPDPEDMGEDAADMQMSDSLTSFARRLDAALKARATATGDGRSAARGSTTDPDPAAATPLGVPTHRSLRVIARERGIL